MEKDTKLPQSFHYGYIVAGFMCLFGSAFWDSLRGPLLPVISKDLGIDYGQMGWFLTIGNITAFCCVSTLLLLINRFSEKALTVAILFVAIATSMMPMMVTGFWSLLALGLTLGASITLMGTICNLLTMKGTPIESRAKVLAGSHMMYGLGCIIAPMVVSFAVIEGLPWKSLVSMMAVFLIGLLIYVARALPAHDPAVVKVKEPLRLTWWQWVPVLVFVCYVAGEVLTSMWMTAYLTEARGFTVSEANVPLMVFFGSIALSRLLCFLFLKPRHEKAVVLGSLIFGIAAFLLGYLVWEPFFGLCGFLGPFYPVFLGKVARAFPAQWRAISIWINMAVQVGLATFHLLVGKLAAVFGLHYAYLIAPLMLFVTLILAEFFISREDKRGQLLPV